MGTAAALANLEVLEEQGLVQSASELGVELESRLEELRDRHRCVGDVRGLGAMWGIELVRNRESASRSLPAIHLTMAMATGLMPPHGRGWSCCDGMSLQGSRQM